jgi:dihydrofolate reductase
MRKLVVSTLVTLDGVVQDPGGFGEIEHGGWAQAYFDPQSQRNSLEQLLDSDVFLLGRTTYEAFYRAWKDNTGDYAEAMHRIPKLVASRTLSGPLPWNASVLSGDVPAEVEKLKQQPGKQILMYGSGTLMHALLAHDLIDELKLGLYPIVLGGGMRLFPDGIAVTRFRLVDSDSTESGAVSLTYQPIRG